MDGERERKESKPPGDSSPDLRPQQLKRAKREGINIRRARAGLILLTGKTTLGEALRQAGYSDATARLPMQSGLSVEACLREARKLDRKADSVALVRKARRLTRRALDGLDDLTDAELAVPKQANIVVKMGEMVERYHGRGQQVAPTTPRPFGERAADVALLLAELQRRGLVGSHENDDSRDSRPTVSVLPAVAKDDARSFED